MIDALRLSVGTLTIVPVGPIVPTRRMMGRAMVLAPVAVLPLAVLAGLLAWLGSRLGLPGLLTGVLVVAGLAWGSRALHLDGLADTADGLGSGWDRDRALAVMKRGDVGPFGVVTLLLMLLAQVVAVAALADRPVLIGVLVCLSRWAVPTVCRRGWSAARPGGLGAGVAGTVPVAVAAAGWLAAVVIMALVPLGGSPDPLLGTVPVVAVVVVWLLATTCVRRFGGITGDVIGAAVEAAFTATLVTTLVVA